MTAVLVDHLWQSTLFAALAALVTLALRDHRATVRYWVWFAASVKFLVPFAALAALGRMIGWRPASADLSWAGGFVQPMSTFGPERGEGFPLGAVLLTLWLTGTAVVIAIWLVRWLRLRAALRGASSVDLAHLVGRTVEVRETTATGPGVVGFFSPVLVVPKGIVQGVAERHLKPVLQHEICHLRRQDNLTALIHMFVEAVFWFHPLVWFVGGRLLVERERACDEFVVAAGASPESYAESILEVCRFHVDAGLPCAAGIGNTALKERIESIVANRRLRHLSRARLAFLAAAAAAAFVVPVLIGSLGAGSAGAQPAAGPASAQPVTEVPEQTEESQSREPSQQDQSVDADPNADVLPLVRIPPEYPPRALARGLEGWVRIEFTITTTGSVKDPVIVAAEPERVFDEAALQSIRRWRFNPREVDGVLVERTGVQTVIRFELTQ